MELSSLERLSTSTLRKMQEAIKDILAARLDTDPRPGRLATFDDGQGNVRSISIERVNPKTVSGVELGSSLTPGKRWRVSRCVLRVEPVERETPSKPTNPEQAHRPSYAGDAW